MIYFINIVIELTILFSIKLLANAVNTTSLFSNRILRNFI